MLITGNIIPHHHYLNVDYYSFIDVLLEILRYILGSIFHKEGILGLVFWNGYMYGYVRLKVWRQY